MTSAAVTKRQADTLRIIREYRDAVGCSPTLQEIGDRLGVNKTTVHHYCLALEQAGGLQGLIESSGSLLGLIESSGGLLALAEASGAMLGLLDSSGLLIGLVEGSTALGLLGDLVPLR